MAALKGLAMKTRILILSLSLLAASAWATPGGVDANGCHASKRVGYHCHGQRASGFAGSAETHVQRDNRLRRECKGGVNAGACAGFTR